MIAGNLYRAWMIPKMGYYSRHPEKYSERFRYEYDRYAINLMKKTGRITTEGFGMENLPKDGGYVMFSNHQGKYDALGIMHTHDTPCSVVMDDARSHGPLVKQFIDLVEGKRLKLDNLKQAAGIIKEVTEEAPIVPVAIVDSWKVFDLWSLRKVKTEVFYLKPMFYDEYKDKKSVEISSIVYNRICSAVDFAQKGEFDKALLQ